MHLPRPLIIAVATLAAGAAAFRALHAAPAPAPFAIVSTSPRTAQAGALAPAGQAVEAGRAGGDGQGDRPGLGMSGQLAGGEQRELGSKRFRRAGGGEGSSAMNPTARLVVYVAGDVVRSGVYTVAAGARGIDALRAAGGAGPDADLVAVNLAQPLRDGQELAVPVKGSMAGALRGSRAGAAQSRPRRAHAAQKTRRKRTSADRPTGEPPAELIDVNAADEATLETLPGVGPALAERIVTMRDQAGPFSMADDLLDVAGMTQTKLDEIAPYITVK